MYPRYEKSGIPLKRPSDEKNAAVTDGEDLSLGLINQIRSSKLQIPQLNLQGPFLVNSIKTPSNSNTAELNPSIQSYLI